MKSYMCRLHVGSFNALYFLYVKHVVIKKFCLVFLTKKTNVKPLYVERRVLHRCDFQLFLQATRRARNPNLQVVITHASHVCSQHSFGLPLRMNYLI